MNDRSPRVRYTAGKGIGAMRTLRRRLLETLFERMLRQALGLEIKGTACAQTWEGETATTLQSASRRLAGQSIFVYRYTQET